MKTMKTIGSCRINRLVFTLGDMLGSTILSVAIESQLFFPPSPVEQVTTEGGCVAEDRNSFSIETRQHVFVEGSRLSSAAKCWWCVCEGMSTRVVVVVGFVGVDVVPVSQPACAQQERVLFERGL